MASRIRENLAEIANALLGVSTYTQPSGGYGPGLGDESVESIRKALGGQLSPLPQTRTRWYLADLETAQHRADSGDLTLVSQLYRSMRRDGTFSGILGTLTSGLIRLPKRFYGQPEIVAALKARNGTRSVFDNMFPASELSLLAGDGRIVGVGVAEMLPVEGRSYPVMCRLDPEFLRYRWSENRWYYNSIAGQIPIVPGDGRWILHTPGGRVAPWQHGLWMCNGRAYINKEHALLHRSNYSAKLANAARVAVSPQGASEGQKQSWFQAVMAWGVNTVFGMTPGYDVKLLESNGRGYEVFGEEIKTSDLEYMISLAGQIVTTNGGAGFANADIHQTIKADIIQDVGEGVAYTVNTQGLPPWIANNYGVDAIEDGAIVEWDVRPPADMKVQAESNTATAKSIVDLGAALKPYGRKVDIAEIINRGGVPVLPDVGTIAPVLVDMSPTDIVGILKVDEARATQGYGVMGDARGDLTIAELEAKSKGTPAPPGGNGGVVGGAPPPAAMPVATDSMVATDAPPTDESSSMLASKMTQHGVPRCEHGSVNRCRLCGIERVRDFDPGADGPSWKVAWRPIQAEAA